MKLLILFSVCFACSYAFYDDYMQEPEEATKNCCAPKKWEGVAITMVAGKGEAFTNMSYDFTNQRVAVHGVAVCRRHRRHHGGHKPHHHHHHHEDEDKDEVHDDDNDDVEATRKHHHHHHHHHHKHDSEDDHASRLFAQLFQMKMSHHEEPEERVEEKVEEKKGKGKGKRVRKLAFRVLADFKARKHYFVYGKNFSKCKVTKIPPKMKMHNCVPAPMKPKHTFWFGAGSGKLSLQPYAYHGKQAAAVSLLTKNGCVPVAAAAMAHVKRKHFRSMTHFLDITTGIKNPSVFKVPKACQKKSDEILLYHEPLYHHYLAAKMAENHHDMAVHHLLPKATWG